MITKKNKNKNRYNKDSSSNSSTDKPENKTRQGKQPEATCTRELQ